MQRVKRVWGQIKDSWREISTVGKLAIIVLIAILIFLVGDYAGLGIFSWAGVRDKTLWDWLQLLIIPAVLAGGALWFNRAEREAERRIADERSKAEREIADERLREATLQAYLDRMTDLLLDNELRTSEEDDEVRAVARARTLTVLRQLDGVRKVTLLRFLYEADLINGDNAVIALHAADLIGINLSDADLIGANLSEVNLSGADLSGADLSEANLGGADLNGADLSGADLSEADLSVANLSGADLGGSKLRNADLGMTDLSEANLTLANLSGADLSGADLCGIDLRVIILGGAKLDAITYDDYTKWPKHFPPPPNAIKKE
jgi:uncharacterized protein YjbI with pentapeptide repeats